MICQALIWGVLLLAGTFMDDSYATAIMSGPVQSASTVPPSTNSTIKTSTVTSTTAQTSKSSNVTTQTTHAPSNTTSHAPIKTTTHPIIHTTPVLPTKPSPPENGNYKVKVANMTCIIADMGLALELNNSTKMQAKDEKGKWYFNVLPSNTHANGTCGESKATLNLLFPEGSIHFVFIKESKTYLIEEVSVTFSWNVAEHWNGTAKNLTLLKTDVGYSVKCKNTPTVKLASNLQLTMADVKLQAFDIHNDILGEEEVCSYDRNIIAVAIAVTILIVIILAIIIYFICRKKRSSGYQRL